MSGSWPSVIEAAGKNVYTLASLAILALYSIAGTYFKKERAAVKLLAFASLILLLGLSITSYFLRKSGLGSLNYNSGNTTITGNGNATSTGNGNCVKVER